MKAMKKVLALALALAMTVTAVPVTNTQAAAAKLKAGKTVSKSYYAGTKHALKLNGVKASKVSKTTWKSSDASVVKCIAGTKTKTSASIRCVKAGKATITAKVTLKTNKTKTYKAKVTVKAISVAVDKEKTKTTLEVGETTTISATKVGPKSAALTYKSENDAVVSVSGGKVTATGEGTANVIVELTSGNKVKREFVPFTVKLPEAGDNGLEILGLTNPISEKYPNTVWVNQKATLNVKYIKDGKPAVGETLVITKNDQTSYNKNAAGAFVDYLNASPVAVTNSNGIATFVIGVNDSGIKVTDDKYVGTYDYTVSVAGSDIKKDGQIAFASIGLGKIRNVNANGDDAARDAYGVKKLAASTNDAKLKADGTLDGNNKGDGVSTTKTASTQSGKNGTLIQGQDVDYVDSQQVSTKDGSVNHKVAFDSFMPHIKLPVSGKDLSSAETFVQDVTDVKDGSYGVYYNNAKTIKLEKNPNELTYATLNFSKLQLSQYTKLVIQCWDAAWAVGDDAWRRSHIIREDEIVGEADMLANGYQIPLDTQYSELVIRLILKSEGQVEDGKNAGYEVKNITGIYKSTGNGDTKEYPLEGAKVTWTTTDPVMSNIKTLTDEENQKIYEISGVDLLGKAAANATLGVAAPSSKQKKGYSKVTYQVPVFPYSGNAVLTCYNTDGISAYYVCPTINQAILRNADNNANENVLDIYGITGRAANGKYCYEVSKDEAFNSVGEIVEQDDKKVVVNSNKVGVTTLKGVLTVDGEPISGLDATNDTMYTSVQWCPVPAAEDPDGHEFALVGQMVNVYAQLVDSEGNPVATAGEEITFNLSNDDIKKVTVLSQEKKTNYKGQAKMVLQCGEAYVIGALSASASKKYNVVLTYDNGDTQWLTHLHWIDVDLQFTDRVDEDAYANGQYVSTKIAGKTIKTSAANPFRDTTEVGIQIKPKTAQHWYLGIKAVPNDPWTNAAVIEGVSIDMSKNAAGVGSFTQVSNGVVNATSLKAGAMEISGKIDSTSASSTVKITTGWGQQFTSVGYGPTVLNKKLTLKTTWEAEGYELAPLTVNGINAAVTTGPAIKTVYVKATDKNGAAIQDKVTFILDTNNASYYGSAQGSVVSTAAGTGTDYIVEVTPNAYGIAAIDIKREGATTLGSTVKAYVKYDTVDQKEVAQTIRWITNPTPFDIDLNAKNDDQTWATNIKDGKIVLTFTDNINRESVVKDMFEVSLTYNYEVTYFEVKGNQIILTVKNLPGNLASDEPVQVTIKHKTTSEGLTYIITSDEGAQLPNNTIFYVYDSSVTKPGLTPVS